MDKKEKKKMSRTKRTVVIVGSVLAALLVLLAVAFFLLKGYFGQIKRFDCDEPTLSQDQIESLLNQDETADPNYTGPVLNADDVTTPENPADSINSDAVINILLVGQDRRDGEGRRHSDSMVLVTINKKSGTITMTSFMRDLWLPIPDRYTERLNVPYMVGGFPLLNDTLEYNFGVRADYNIEVDFAGFEAVVDAVGGVDISLTSAEANYLNKRGNWTAGETYNGDWTLQKGVNHLTGKQALAYSRIRDLDSDFGRTGRQRVVLEALMEKIKGMNITKAIGLIKTLIPLVKTDMTDAQILDLAFELLPMLSKTQVVSQRIPADGAYKDVKLVDKGYTKYVLVMDEKDLETNIKLLKDAIGEN